MKEPSQGLCECGCGAAVSRRFMPGHNNYVQPPDWQRVLDRCVRIGDCLVWQGAPRQDGYGGLSVRGKTRPIHRIVYEHFVGPVPPGLVLDHVRAKGCRFTTCVEPTHLEAVTQRENVRRSRNFVAENMAKTHCKRGHPLSGDNLMAKRSGRDTRRRCKACAREAWRSSKTSV